MDLSPQHRQGSVVGSTLLISGSCIGAGMLGLPANSAIAGYGPSLLLFAATWFFMMTTGLLLLEVNLSFDHEVNIITMADKTLGKWGRYAAWGLFLFLFYSLMVAFISGCGELFGDFVGDAGGIEISHGLGNIICTFIFAVFIYFGAFAVDHFNRLLMAGMAASYLMLLYYAAPHVRLERLTHVGLSEALWVVPVMVISFGYHNLIPSLTHYLKGNGRGLKKAVIIGSALPLIAYILWETVILGIVPFEEFSGGHIVTRIIKNAVDNAAVVSVAQYFAFFAIVTTLLGVGLSLVDFLADGFEIKKDRSGKLLLCCMALGPPLIFSLLYPRLFVEALKYAGGFGAVLLFGVLPALMVWKGRYSAGGWKERLVPGGKGVLLLVIGCALAVFTIQLANALFFHR